MVAYDDTGKCYSLTESSAKGGEGRICFVDGSPGICAKILKPEKATKGRYAKVCEWIRLRQSHALDLDFLSQVTVPEACLYSNAYKHDLSSFTGYTMEKLDGFLKLGDVYKNKALDFRGNVTMAINLCIITNNIHSKGIIVGDYNADNIVIFRNSCAKLIDTDSMQLVINNSGKRTLLPCSVGKPEFMPPEIKLRLNREKADLLSVTQGINNPVFTRYTDYYMLAFHIFSLLMNGAAPYSSMADMAEISRHPSKTVSDVDLNLEAAALKGEFIFAGNQNLRKPPAYAPDYNILSDKLKALFERSFIDGAKNPSSRPGPEEYFPALKDYCISLKKRPCGHYMPSHYNGQCQWCALRARGH